MAGKKARAESAVAVIVSATVVLIGAIIVLSNQGENTAASMVIVPLRDMPQLSKLSDKTRALIEAANEHADGRGGSAVRAPSVRDSRVASSRRRIVHNSASKRPARPPDPTIVDSTLTPKTRARVRAGVTAVVHRTESELRRDVEGAFERDLARQVKAAVRGAVNRVLNPGSLATAERRGARARGVRGRVAPRATVRAEMPLAGTGAHGARHVEEAREYGAELEHIKKELANQVGGLIDTIVNVDIGKHSTSSRVTSSRLHHVTVNSVTVKANHLVRAAQKRRARDGFTVQASDIIRSLHAIARQSNQDRGAQQTKPLASAAEKLLAATDHSAKKVLKAESPAEKQKHVLTGIPEEKIGVATAAGKKVFGIERHDDDASSSKVPITSRHNPVYERSEEHRTKEADEMLKRLEAAQQDKKKAQKRSRLAARNVLLKKSVDSTADKMLKNLPKTMKYIATFKREIVKNAPVTSRHNAAYVKGQAGRDSQAAFDMTLLKRGQAPVMKRGSVVDEVRLRDRSVFPPQSRTMASRRAGTSKTLAADALAQNDLKKLPQLETAAHGTAGPLVKELAPTGAGSAESRRMGVAHVTANVRAKQALS